VPFLACPNARRPTPLTNRLPQRLAWALAFLLPLAWLLPQTLPAALALPGTSPPGAWAAPPAVLLALAGAARLARPRRAAALAVRGVGVQVEPDPSSFLWGRSGRGGAVTRALSALILGPNAAPAPAALVPWERCHSCLVVERVGTTSVWGELALVARAPGGGTGAGGRSLRRRSRGEGGDKKGWGETGGGEGRDSEIDPRPPAGQLVPLLGGLRPPLAELGRAASAIDDLIFGVETCEGEKGGEGAGLSVIVH